MATLTTLVLTAARHVVLPSVATTIFLPIWDPLVSRVNTRSRVRVQYTPPMAQESKKAVVAAIIGNVAIAAIKFVAGAMTGSSAMISEGIHSLVDTGNGGLLYYGLNRGARPADDQHPQLEVLHALITPSERAPSR